MDYNKKKKFTFRKETLNLWTIDGNFKSNKEINILKIFFENIGQTSKLRKEQK